MVKLPTHYPSSNYNSSSKSFSPFRKGIWSPNRNFGYVMHNLKPFSNFNYFCHSITFRIRLIFNCFVYNDTNNDTNKLFGGTNDILPNKSP